MSNNCLVTKLIGVVNDDLPKYGVLVAEFTDNVHSASAALGIISKSATKIKAIDSPLYSTGGANWGYEVLVPENEEVWVCPSSGKVEIYGKYDIKKLVLIRGHFAPVDTIDLKYCTDLKELTSMLSGELNNLSGLTVMEKLILQRNSADYSLTGNIESLAGMTELTQLNIVLCKGLTGQLSSLGNLTKLTSIAIGDTNISGSIEDFVVAQRTSGRTACEFLDMAWIGSSKVTFNGGTISNSGSTVLSWTSSTITLAGTTINA